MTLMDLKLISLCMDGAELQAPDLELSFPLDFVIVGDHRTLIVRADWWQKSWGIGEQISAIEGEPRWDQQAGLWTFDHEFGYTMSIPGSDDEASFLAQMRQRTDLHRANYLRQLLLLTEGEPDMNFAPWLEAIMDRPEITVADLADGETQEREVGKIRLLSGGEAVLDTLVIDELGSAASLQPDGYLASFAEEWMSYAEVDRPSMAKFVEWLATQTPYGDRYLTDAGVVSASGDVEEIALQLGSR